MLLHWTLNFSALTYLGSKYRFEYDHEISPPLLVNEITTYALSIDGHLCRFLLDRPKCSSMCAYIYYSACMVSIRWIWKYVCKEISGGMSNKCLTLQSDIYKCTEFYKLRLLLFHVVKKYENILSNTKINKFHSYIWWCHSDSEEIWWAFYHVTRTMLYMLNNSYFFGSREC